MTTAVSIQDLPLLGLIVQGRPCIDTARVMSIAAVRDSTTVRLPGNTADHINQVAGRRARLVLGWVTVAIPS